MTKSDDTKRARGGSRPTVVIVEDDPALQAMLGELLDGEGYALRAFESGEECLAAIGDVLADAILLDVQLPGIDGLEVLKRLKQRHPETPVIMLTGKDDADTAVAAMRLGALEYLTKPADATRLRTTLRNAVSRREMALRVRQLEHEVERGGFPGIVGKSDVMQAVYGEVHRVAPTDVTVLIHGESGTGKELIARAIHGASRRSEGDFVAINCAAVPESLQEAELFGHEEGAFTGALARREGRFEQAHGGTLFLDEVGELAVPLQAKLLRVIQDRSFHRVGGSDDVTSDFRLLVATHRDLEPDVRSGRFREDLYFRLAVYELQVPPLRERGEDVLHLARRFAEQFGDAIRGEPCTLDPEAEAAIARYAWPGNVRELQNAIQRAVLTSAGTLLPAYALPDGVAPEAAAPAGAGGSTAAASARTPEQRAELIAGALAGLTLAEIEQIAVRAALARHDGSRTEAARELGIARSTLYRKLSEEVDAEAS